MYLKNGLHLSPIIRIRLENIGFLLPNQNFQNLKLVLQLGKLKKLFMVVILKTQWLKMVQYT